MLIRTQTLKLIFVLAVSTLGFSSPVFSSESMNHLHPELIRFVTEHKNREILPVSMGILRGPRPELKQIRELSLRLVKTVVNLQGGDVTLPHIGSLMPYFQPGEHPGQIALATDWAREYGIQTIHVPLPSLRALLPHEEAAVKELIEHLGQRGAHPIYIHCEHGVDRTGLIVALYRVRHEGWTAREAYQEWVERGRTPFRAYFTQGLQAFFFKTAAEFEKARLKSAEPGSRQGLCRRAL